MTDYTPTTEEVFFAYHLFKTGGIWKDKCQLEFDRWLAEVKADAWDEGFDAGEHDVFGRIAKVEWDKEHTCIPNPYRQGEEQ